MKLRWLVHPFLRNWRARFGLVALPLFVLTAFVLKYGTAFALTAGQFDHESFIYFLVSTITLMMLGICFALYYYREGEIGRFDPLTGCLQRKPFFEQLYAEVSRANRFDRPLALIMVDIDHFKSVNDRFGHPTGDRLLEELGPILRGSIYPERGDFAGRYGGEEFTICLIEPNEQGVEMVVGRIQQSLRDFNWTKHGLPAVTVSIGYAKLTQDARVAEDLVDFADRALFRAKHTGRNQAIAYHDGLPVHPHHSRL